MMLHSKITGEGFPIILIHGLFGMGDNLSMIARPLAEHYQVHSIDLRNHGRSPRADSMAFVDMAEDVLAYMDAQDIERAHILGHSLGGKVAMQLALMAPQRVAKIIVADIAPVTYSRDGHDDVFAAIRSVDLAAINSRAEAEAVVKQHVQDQAIALFVLKNLYRNESGRFDWRINVDALEACYDQMREGLSFDKPFEGDILFIKGENSAYIQQKHRDTIMQMFPNAKLKIIQGASHWLHAEKTTAFNKVVAGFLDKQ